MTHTMMASPMIVRDLVGPRPSQHAFKLRSARQ
jgi:hypothetical protein